MRQLAVMFACASLFLTVSPEGFSRALPSTNAETAVAPKVLLVEGLLQGFLLLRSVEGEVLTEGDTQVAHGDKLKSSLVSISKTLPFIKRT